MVGINVPIPVPGLGCRSASMDEAWVYRRAMHAEGVRFYTRGKVVTSRWPEAADAMIDLAFPTAT